MSENTPTVVASSVPLHISSIVIRLDDVSNKKVDFAELEFDSQRQEIRHSSEQEKDLSANFDPAIAVTTERVSLSVHCQHRTMGKFLRNTTVKFSLNKKDILPNTVDHDGQREYRTIKGKMTVVITVSQLQSTSSDVLQICPRFRLLVIGKTGVGKSSLIQQAFGINEVHVSEHRRGEADIDKEFVSPENRRFVLHDSQGFEAGDSSCFTTAKDFIGRRRKMLKLQDKIHAVWLCLAIPHADERLLENGVEEFLKLRKEILGDIPIIAVFTKHDVFVAKLELDAMESDEYDGAALEALKIDTLDKLCVQPLKEAAGTDILHTPVSTKEGYESTIRQLIDLTTTNVEKYVASEAALTMMIAQRIDIGLKVKASIAIGKKRYWRGIGSSINFIGFTMLDCLSVIHKDIIDVWNFNDPRGHLISDQFKALILKDLDNADLPHTGEAFDFGLSVVSKITAIVASLAGPFLPVVVSVAAGVVLVKWVYDTYQRTKIVLQRIMTYIVDLTCIMQILFLLAPTGSISPRVIKVAIKAYGEAGRNNVHSEIQSHVSVTRSGGDDALEEIVRLINDHSIKAEQVQDLRAEIKLPVGLQADEEW
jgi:GTPase SAR1 family protein